MSALKFHQKLEEKFLIATPRKLSLYYAGSDTMDAWIQKYNCSFMWISRIISEKGIKEEKREKKIKKKNNAYQNPRAGRPGSHIHINGIFSIFKKKNWSPKNYKIVPAIWKTTAKSPCTT